MLSGKPIGKESSVSGLSSNYPKPFNQDSGRPGKDVPDGEVINIMQDEEEHSGKFYHAEKKIISIRNIAIKNKSEDILRKIIDSFREFNTQ